MMLGERSRIEMKTTLLHEVDFAYMEHTYASQSQPYLLRMFLHDYISGNFFKLG